MRLSRVLSVVCLALFALPAFAGGIRGDYVETRTADVYTGPCFANGEVNLVGSEAVLAWKVREGAWDGVALDGLTVVAVARGNATLGDPYRDPYPAQAVLIFDERASETQKGALAAFARAMSGRLLENVVMKHSAPIRMEVGVGGEHCAAVVEAGTLAAVRTRGVSGGDHVCGNESTYYPPLTELEHSMPAIALANEYAGGSLGAEWHIFGKRSAFVGSFDR